jgi:hypothetical protein
MSVWLPYEDHDAISEAFTCIADSRRRDCPGILFVGAALKSRGDILREGEDEVTRSIADVGDNVHLVLDTERRTLTSVDDHIDGMTWEDVAKPDTSLFLRTLASSMEGIKTIWVADPDGYIKAASEPLDRGVRVPEKEFFATRHQDDANIYLSTVIEGTPPRIVSIDMIRRRLTLSGASNGSIHAALNAAYFVHLFQTAAPLADDVVLLRGDGEILADSHSTNHYLTTTTPLMLNVAGYPAGRMFADKERLYSYLQVPGFPVHIGFAVSKFALLRRWYEGSRRL